MAQQLTLFEPMYESFNQSCSSMILLKNTFQLVFPMKLVNIQYTSHITFKQTRPRMRA